MYLSKLDNFINKNSNIIWNGELTDGDINLDLSNYPHLIVNVMFYDSSQLIESILVLKNQKSWYYESVGMSEDSSGYIFFDNTKLNHTRYTTTGYQKIISIVGFY